MQSWLPLTVTGSYRMKEATLLARSINFLVNYTDLLEVQYNYTRHLLIHFGQGSVLPINRGVLSVLTLNLRRGQCKSPVIFRYCLYILTYPQQITLGGSFKILTTSSDVLGPLIFFSFKKIRP